ncbi:hypothetical protein ACRE_055140 [Hapsidospora chrysogenum ATCC 11550]|uniref:DUF7053 domain-containing protein n=1 Tax=Hapsidospora chrysogenum (strain ATCC 11550 / CBS 779.69 / DSM 880 / IAM 14645 / JCM 23072 / IMI 49137) TaxID=857340 RepID=A0A086T2Y5_HAPC1|nr:hypothetical protein ACRE_055140 [Hapsidospora chrysogenum ATCC 11550]
MPKRTTFTSITPLPPGITREVAIAFLHNHMDMIDLNPLVIERHPIPPPDHAEPDELSCAWYSITDRISYIPGVDAASGNVTYTGAFHDMPWGLQTHCHAPMGLDIRDKWSVGGSLPGETPQPQELGLGAPLTGLYLREDVDFRCSILMAAFVKKTMKKAHATLVEAMTAKAQRMQTGPAPGLGLPGPTVTRDPEEDAGTSRQQNQQHHEIRQHHHQPSMFVSSGANQGQPGQLGPKHPRQVSGMHETDPYGGRPGQWRGQTPNEIPGVFEAPGSEPVGPARVR